jgi:hypothetical protein
MIYKGLDLAPAAQTRGHQIAGEGAVSDRQAGEIGMIPDGVVERPSSVEHGFEDIKGDGAGGWGIRGFHGRANLVAPPRLATEYRRPFRLYGKCFRTGIKEKAIMAKAEKQTEEKPPDTEGGATKPRPEKRDEEVGGPKGLEPIRYGDWESKGRCIDF